ncbi:MAG TPA: LegC family aminotransferase [Bacillota bacterium]|nr:LegC family aminotransferase [Bacillota bacterium]
MSKSVDLNEVIRAIQGVLPVDKSFIGLHEPKFSGREWDYVKECLDTGWVSSVGKFVDEFEAGLAAYTGAGYAVATVNGTAALHICLKLVGVEPGDEVLMPALTFIATANAVSYCGAVPHFADISESTLGLDPDKLDQYLKDISEIRAEGCFNRLTGRRIKAVVPMHTFGHPVDMDVLSDVAERYKLELVEDAAEALGSYYKGKHAGCFGKVSALSFNGNKILTTGGGGAILTNNQDLARLAKHITTTAKTAHKWAFNHDMIGYNYRLPNINAAMGCAQLEQLPVFLEQKRSLANHYKEAFSGIKGIKFVTEPVHSKSNYWLNAILLDEPNEAHLESLLEMTNNMGIMTRPVWTPMHKLPMFESCPGMLLTTTENIQRRLINIPSGAMLGE